VDVDTIEVILTCLAAAAIIGILFGAVLTGHR